MKYEVRFSGFAYIEAESEKEAEEKYHEDDICYKEEWVDNVEETDEFTYML